MLDRERILAKLDQMEGYLSELHEIAPTSFDEYQKIEKKRACERLLQLCIESVIDVCGLMVSGLRLGLPAEEDDLFEKLDQAGIISASMRETLRSMKGLRNILVHEYGRVDDRLVYQVLQGQLEDFEAFRQEVLQALRDGSTSSP